MQLSKAEATHLAQQRFGPGARVFTFTDRLNGERSEWFGLSVCGTIIGARRSLDELPQLITRGPLEVGITQNKRPDPCGDSAGVP